MIMASFTFLLTLFFSLSTMCDSKCMPRTSVPKWLATADCSVLPYRACALCSLLRCSAVLAVSPMETFLKRHSPLYFLMPEKLNAPGLLHPLLVKISRTVRTRVCSRDAGCIRLRRITSVPKKTPARAAFLPRAVPRHSSKTMPSKAIQNFQKQQKTTKR